jgi:ElaB/YqjD/DUF883 family membrane-anchored ribosome-binding protein
MNKSTAKAFSEKISMQGANEMAQSSTHSRPAAHEVKEKTTEQFDMMVDRAKDRLSSVVDQAEHVANRVAEQGRDTGERVQEVAGNFKGAVDRSVKDQPMATLAIAAVIGFVLGALWKS